jgi:[protein-PII] uridylyltransferase
VSVTTTPSSDARGAVPHGTAYRTARAELLGSSELRGLALVGALSHLTETLIAAVAADRPWPAGWALLATGGTGRRELCPGSDLDLLLLHPKKATDAEVARFGESLWYPLWDSGLDVAPGVHTVESAVELGERELLSALAWIDARHVAGDLEPSDRFRKACASSRRKHVKRQLAELANLTRLRHDRAGDVAFLLGPDLRDGRGGLRDLLVLRWLVAVGTDDALGTLECNPDDLREHRDALLAVRAELHRTTGRSQDLLALQEQDAVAAALQVADADALLASVSAAARSIAWSCDETLRRIESLVNRQRTYRVTSRVRLTSDVSAERGEVVLSDTAQLRDPTLALRVGAAAAQHDLPIARTALRALADAAVPMPDPWPDRARQALVVLLGAGTPTTRVIEALDRHGLMSLALPEWESVRCKPQRNAYHRFTVDRHLVEAASNAAALVRTVARPDLLLVGTWLHDIGKGYPGDHTDVGVVIVDQIGRRMGFSDDEVATLVALVRHHLLLPETATRRDLSDPSVVENVARLVGDVDTLHLLRALTEADSIATGPTAWSHWKGQLCTDLVHRVERVLAGHRPPEPQLADGPGALRALAEVRSGKPISLQVHAEPNAPDLSVLTVAAVDRAGLFRALTGALAVSGADVVGADVWTTDDGIALDVLRISRRLGGETDWRRVERFMRGALDGTVDLRAELDKRRKAYERNDRTGADPDVLVDDDIEERATVVEVRAPDMFGLLHRIAATLTDLGLDIRTAKVTTLGHEVVDSFSVVRVLPDGKRSKFSPTGPTNEAVRSALLAELSSVRRPAMGSD